MKILIVGSGLSGCAIARILHDRGHEVQIIEKNNRIGGLCITDVNKDGLKYEPFGARTFHTNDQKVIDFVKRFDEWNGYTHRKGMIINGKIFHFPIRREDMEYLPNKKKIFKELDNLPVKINNTNFETACISIFGKTLYKYFIKNYTEKMWGRKAKELTAEWAPTRLKLGEKGETVFHGQWQGLPKHGYSYLLEKMIDGIPINLRASEYDPEDYDLVISSAPIDKTLHYRFGKLEYRSMEFDYNRDEEWEYNKWGTINLPQHKEYIRKCNFKVLHQQTSDHNLIQYQKPVACKGSNPPMYPVNTIYNNHIFEKYLKAISERENIIPFGRLGLFVYLNMDEAVSSAFKIADLAEEYLHLFSINKYMKLREIRNI